MNMNDTIDLSGISADNIYRIRRSKKNGKLISHNEYGKVIIIKNWKSLHVGYGKVVSFENRENCILATMKNVSYDFYEEYNEKTGEVEAVPYEELTRILQELGFTHEYKEDIDKDNIFDVWANLNTGVLITIETWNQDGGRGYNSVKCYVPVNTQPQKQTSLNLHSAAKRPALLADSKKSKPIRMLMHPNLKRITAKSSFSESTIWLPSTLKLLLCGVPKTRFVPTKSAATAPKR